MEVLLTSVVLAIPISIIANLLTGPVQRRLDRRLKQQSVRREQNQAKFRAHVEELAADKTLFTNYLTIQILRTTFFSALFGLLAGLAFAAGSVISTRDFYIGPDLVDYIYVLGQALALMGSLLVLTVVRAALQTTSAVREARARTVPDQPPDETT